MKMTGYGPGQIISMLDADVVTMRRRLLQLPREGRRQRNEDALIAIETMKAQLPASPMTAWGMGVLMCNQTWAVTIDGMALPAIAAHNLIHCMYAGAAVGITAYTGVPPYKPAQL